MILSVLEYDWPIVSQLNKNSFFDVVLSFKVGLEVLNIMRSLISSKSLSPSIENFVKSPSIAVCWIIKMCQLIFDSFTNVGFRALPVLGEILMCFKNHTF